MAVDKIQVPAQVTDFRPMADRSYKLVFNTRELSAQDVTVLASNFQGEGWLVFSPNPLESGDVPESTVESGAKTPSQRLRNVIYVLWKQRGGTGDFDAYYRTKMSQLVDHIKTQLEEDRM